MAFTSDKQRDGVRLPINISKISFYVIFIFLALFSVYWLAIVSRIRVGDDFFIYYQSFIKAISGESPYLPYKIGDSFINHPFVLSLFTLFSWHRIISISFIIWTIASITAWIAVIRLTVYLIQSNKEVKEYYNEKNFTWHFILVFICFAPFLETIYIGQINVFVILTILLVFYYSESNKSFIAGLFLALAIVLKTSPFILIFYFLSLRNYKLVLSSLTFLILLTIIPILQFSTQLLNDFLVVLLNISFVIKPNPYNESLLGVVARIISKMGYIDHIFLLRLANKIFFIIVLCIVLIPNLFKNPSRFSIVWQFAFMLVVMTISSPLVWYHHSVF